MDVTPAEVAAASRSPLSPLTAGDTLPELASTLET
jgi:hypothetical protein